ncbi:MAG: HEAT repeat domain-containing protein [Desulfobacterales bacterium]|nr:HEAT repeat domain-containing protein [Desulfobacterales bacterium]
MNFLKEKFSSQKIRDRKEVAEIMGQAPSKHGTALLIEMVKDEDHDIKIQAISSLGLSKDESALLHLHNLLQDSNFKIRKATVEAWKSRQSLSRQKTVCKAKTKQKTLVPLCSLSCN